MRIQAHGDVERLVAEATPNIKRYDDGFVGRGVRVDTKCDERSAQIKLYANDVEHYGLHVGNDNSVEVFAVQVLGSEGAKVSGLSILVADLRTMCRAAHSRRSLHTFLIRPLGSRLVMVD